MLKDAILLNDIFFVTKGITKYPHKMRSMLLCYEILNLKEKTVDNIKYDTCFNHLKILIGENYINENIINEIIEYYERNKSKTF